MVCWKKKSYLVAETVVAWYVIAGMAAYTSNKWMTLDKRNIKYTIAILHLYIHEVCKKKCHSSREK
jgi:hypothetical protein